MTCRNSHSNESTKAGESSGVEISSRPHDLDDKLKELYWLGIELLFGAIPVVGTLLVLCSFAYLFEGSGFASLVSGTIGVILLSYYARK